MNERRPPAPFRETGWSRLRAPDIATFELLARDAFSRLPARFRDLCADVVIRVRDFPGEHEMRELGLQTEFDLLGLFSGVGLAAGGPGQWTGQMPNMITLYRRPILDYWADSEEMLGAIISHVLIHEIGHHFGLSDADMERVEQSTGETGDG